MKRVFSHPLTALVIGLLLRLFFVFRYPSSAGDTQLYDNLASNWLQHGVYGISIDGVLTPLDIRMPGYPAYLALIHAISRRSGDAAHVWIMLGQVILDLACCLVIAALASRCARNENASRVFAIALWLAVLCPFTANYTAVPLTETFAILCTALALRPGAAGHHGILQRGFSALGQISPALRIHEKCRTRRLLRWLGYSLSP